MPLTPIEYTKQLWENQQAEINELKASLALIHQSYLRLRELIPGAFNIPKGPTSQQAYETTENALKRFISENIREP